jgi:2-methylcitrate dehydratase PrpD
VVVNPVIDVCLRLREREALTLGDVAEIEVTGHPLLRQRTDRPNVKTGREGQVSTQHTIAIVLLRGRATLEEFTDAAATETQQAGRPTVIFHDEPGRDIASIDFFVRTRDGRELRETIETSLGSRSNPLSDKQLEQKLFDAAKLVGFKGDTRRLVDTIWRIEKVEDAGEIVRLAAQVS